MFERPTTVVRWQSCLLYNMCVIIFLPFCAPRFSRKSYAQRQEIIYAYNIVFLTKPVTRCVVAYNTKCQTRTIGCGDTVLGARCQGWKRKQSRANPRGTHSTVFSRYHRIIIRRKLFFCFSKPRRFPLNAFARVGLSY